MIRNSTLLFALLGLALGGGGGLVFRSLGLPVDSERTYVTSAPRLLQTLSSPDGTWTASVSIADRREGSAEQSVMSFMIATADGGSATVWERSAPAPGPVDAAQLGFVEWRDASTVSFRYSPDRNIRFSVELRPVSPASTLHPNSD